MSHSKNNWLLSLLPVLGISFWFAIAFPFDDRNESYIWIASLEKASFSEVLQNQIPTIRNFRPLAQVFTWCLYHLSGQNSVLIQLTNFILLCVAIWIMTSLMAEPKRSYARIFYLAIGFVYFPAFYYIFNLHGIFYSPMLLLIALLLRAQDAVLKNWKPWFFACLTLTFFHPLVLVFFVAYTAGWLIEKKQVDRDKIILLGFMLMLLLVLLNMLLPFSILSVINVQNIVGTTRNVEQHMVTKILTLVLCLLPMLDRPLRHRILLGVVIVCYLALWLIYHLPLLLLLGLLILLTLVMEKKWSLAGLVATAVSFPLAVGSGAPTKASIFIFLLPFLILRPLTLPVIKEPLLKSAAVLVLAAFICCVVMVRMEINVPFLSDKIRPVLVEKAKTYQLKSALALAGREHPPRRIHFLQEKPGNIRDHGQPLKRDNFPPTKQGELDVYQRHLFSGYVWNTLPVWYLVFGTTFQQDTLTLIHTLEEENAAPAHLYAPREPDGE